MPSYDPPDSFGNPEPPAFNPEDSPLNYRPVLPEEAGQIFVDYLETCFSDKIRLMNPYLDHLVDSESQSLKVVYGLEADRGEHSPKIVVVPFPYQPGANIPTIADAGINVKINGQQKSQANINLLQGSCQFIIRSEHREQARSIQSELQLLFMRDRNFLQRELNVQSLNMTNEDLMEKEERSGQGRSTRPGSDFPFYSAVTWGASYSAELWTERVF